MPTVGCNKRVWTDGAQVSCFLLERSATKWITPSPFLFFFHVVGGRPYRPFLTFIFFYPFLFSVATSFCASTFSVCLICEWSFMWFIFFHSLSSSLFVLAFFSLHSYILTFLRKSLLLRRLAYMHNKRVSRCVCNIFRTFFFTVELCRQHLENVAFM